MSAVSAKYPLGMVSSNWQAPGPLSLRYVNSTSPNVFVMGPIGSGKTSTSFMKCFRNAGRQPVQVSRKIRQYKCTVVCDTYKNLHNKALRTFKEGIVPEGHPNAEFRGGKGEDVEVKLRTLIGGVETHLWWHFLAVGDKNIDSITAGLLTTDVYLYETDKLPEAAVDEFAKRLARYPEVDDFPEGEYIFSQLFGDFNAPAETHPLIRRLLSGKDTDEFIIFPSGFDPEAENLAALERRQPGYYQLRAKQMADDAVIKQQIENKLGYSRDGHPVYTDYSNEQHTSRTELTPDGDLPLIVGVDGGGSAAAVICQPLMSGSLHALAEIVTEKGDFTTAEDFGQLVARVLAQRYPGRAAIAAVDPANTARSATSKDQMSWLAQFQAASGLTCYPAQTNQLHRPGQPLTEVTQDTRIGSVRTYLRRMLGGKPAFQVNKECVTLREGFTSGYILKKRKTVAGIEFAEKPDKNSHYSHVHDALQYACLMALNSRGLLHQTIANSARRNAALAGHHTPQITVING